jgi:hypothetical protein
MLRRLLNRLRAQSPDDQPAPAPVPRDYAQEREDRMQAKLSDEDRAWGEASRQRDRDNRARDDAPPVR